MLQSRLVSELLQWRAASGWFYRKIRDRRFQSPGLWDNRPRPAQCPDPAIRKELLLWNHLPKRLPRSSPFLFRRFYLIYPALVRVPSFYHLLYSSLIINFFTNKELKCYPDGYLLNFVAI